MNETRRKDPRRARKAWRIAAALIGLLAAPSAHAQVATGTILGNVKDTTGAAVPTAIVTATNIGTQFSRSTTTDGEGQYALPQLDHRCRKLQHLRFLPPDDLFTRLLVCHHRKHAKPIDQFRGRPGFVRETLRIRSKVRSQLFEYGFLQGKDESGSFLRSESLGCARS